MDGLRKLIARIFFRTSNAPVVEASDGAAQAVAQVQEALENGEQCKNAADLAAPRPTLRKTLNDVPAVVTPPNFGKDRPWFNGQSNYQSQPRKNSNTFNRLEAFLSTTDPDRLTQLDPNWNKPLAGVDDRPQPKTASVDLPKINRAPIKEVRQPEVSLEGVLSESMS